MSATSTIETARPALFAGATLASGIGLAPFSPLRRVSGRIAQDLAVVVLHRPGPRHAGRGVRTGRPLLSRTLVPRSLLG